MNRYHVERYDQEDGSITYEIWDNKPDTRHRMCLLNEWADLEDGMQDNPTAKNDAELIVRALNLMEGQP